MLPRLLAAACAGAVLALAFEPLALAWSMPLSLAGLALLLSGLHGPHRARRGYLLGATYGTAFMLTLLPWLSVVTPAWPALALLEGLLIGVVGAATAAVNDRRWWPVAFAFLWVSLEAVRGGWPLGGFPWGRLAFGVVDTPAAALLPWVGAAGAGFALALLGGVLAWAVLRVRERPVPVLAAVAATLLLVGAGWWVPLDPAARVVAGDPVQVAAVQGDTPGVGLAAMAERRRVLANHVAATTEHAGAVERGEARQPDLVFWPENSSDIDPFRDDEAFTAISGAVQAVAAPVLTGLVVDDGDGWRNRVQVWTEEGVPADAYYDKQKAVPFGEYVPFRSVLQPLVPALDQIPRDMLPGGRLGLLDVNGTRIGVLTCFEIAYSGLQTALAARDAELLVVPTNNATYMGTAQVDQQFAMARLAALTTHRPVVVVATNGVSAIVDTDGSVVRRAPVRTSAVLTAALAPRTGSTPAVALATPLAWGFALPGILLVVLLAAGRGRALVRRRRGGPAVGTDAGEDR